MRAFNSLRKQIIPAKLRPSVAFLRRCWGVPLLLGSSVLCTPALADEGDVLRPYVGISMFYDDNVLGITDDAIAAGTATRLSDTSRRVEAGLIIDKTISRQKLTANLNVNHTSYNRFDTLDYTGRDFQGNWNWRVGDHVDGNLGASYVRALTPFQDFHLPQLNMRTQKREYVDGGWLFHPSWRVRGGVSHYEIDYDLGAQQVNNRSVDDAQIGIDYLARSGSSIGLQYNHSKADFPNLQTLGGGLLVDNNYDQNELKAKVDWKYSGKTDLQFLGGWVRRHYDTATERDFSGFNARAVAVWRATGKTTATLTLWREIGSVDDLTAAYSLNRGASLGLNWDISYKTKFDAFLQREGRDYTVSATGPASPYFGRKDYFNTASVRLTWLATRNFRIQLSVYRTIQDSNVAFVAYRNTGATLTTRLEF